MTVSDQKIKDKTRFCPICEARSLGVQLVEGEWIISCSQCPYEDENEFFLRGEAFSYLKHNYDSD